MQATPHSKQASMRAFVQHTQKGSVDIIVTGASVAGGVPGLLDDNGGIVHVVACARSQLQRASAKQRSHTHARARSLYASTYSSL
jgi:phosphoribosylcarboxyaminoimidazole (NCAIR) mutase